GNVLDVGPHSVSASYAGDADFDVASAGPVTVNVQKANTTTSLSAPTLTPVSGQVVRVTAKVQVPGGVIVPTGTVSFTRDGNPIGTVMLDGAGTAFVDLTGVIFPRPHRLRATLNGDVNFNGSGTTTATDLVLTYSKADTTTVGSFLPLTPSLGQTVTISATVTPNAPGGGTPTGTVTFTEGSTILRTVSLSGG